MLWCAILPHAVASVLRAELQHAVCCVMLRCMSSSRGSHALPCHVVDAAVSVLYGDVPRTV